MAKHLQPVRPSWADTGLVEVVSASAVAKRVFAVNFPRVSAGLEEDEDDIFCCCEFKIL